MRLADGVGQQQQRIYLYLRETSCPTEISTLFIIFHRPGHARTYQNIARIDLVSIIFDLFSVESLSFIFKCIKREKESGLRSWAVRRHRLRPSLLGLNLLIISVHLFCMIKKYL